MNRPNFIPIQAFTNPLSIPDSSSRINQNQRNGIKKAPPSKIKSTIITVVVVVLLVGILTAAIVVPLVLTLGKSTSETTAGEVKTSSTATTVYIRWNTGGTTVAGNANISAGVSSNLFNFPTGLALGSANTIYIADSGNNRIQKWVIGASSGTTVAGFSNGTSGVSLDALTSPNGIVLDANDNMYISDSGAHRIIYWPNGALSGSLYAGVTDVPGNSTSDLYFPVGLYLDRTTGNLYIADSFNHRIVRYAPNASSGTIVAGGNDAGFRTTQLLIPYSVAFDAATNSLIIVNNGAHNVVRWVIGDSSWTLMAGSSQGRPGSTSTLLSSPNNAILDTYGNLYVVDSGNHRIQRFFYGQSNGTTVAGTSRFSGTSATNLNRPFAIVLDSQLDLYIADASNNRIQKFSRI